MLLLCGALLPAGCAARAPAVGAAKTASPDWARLARLERGTSLKVLTPAGPVSGRFLAADDGQIQIRAAAADLAISRSDVRRVSVQERSTGQKAKRGFAFGALAGALVGGFATKSNRVPWAAFLAVGWGSIGAVIGAVDGATTRREAVIYTASP